jgi:hypothetical protein
VPGVHHPAGDFQVIYEQANAHGQKVQTAGSNMAAPIAPSAQAGRNCISQESR